MHGYLYAVPEIAGKILQIEAVLMAFGLDLEFSDPDDPTGSLDISHGLQCGPYELSWGSFDRGPRHRDRYIASINIGMHKGDTSLDLELVWEADGDPFWRATHKVTGTESQVSDFPELAELVALHDGFSRPTSQAISVDEAFRIIGAMAKWFSSRVQEHEGE